MTDHVAITYLKSDAGKQLAVQAVPIGGRLPPIHPPQLLNPMQSVEFDIEAGEELIIAPASVLPQPSLSRPQSALTQPVIPVPVAKPFIAGSQGFAIPPLKGAASIGTTPQTFTGPSTGNAVGTVSQR